MPLFRLLGVAPEHKRHALFDGGHAPGQLPDVIREILDWFDRYLGPSSLRRFRKLTLRSVAEI